jgi:hypothetical protein
LSKWTLQRGLDIKRVGHLYTFDAPFGETICTYCGEFATTLDHVLPVSAAVSLYDVIMGDRARYRHGLKIVPCCRDCNSRLGGRFFTCISDKRAALARLLRRRHSRLLGAYDWQNDELADMGHMLQVYISSKDSKRKTIEDRIRFARSGGRAQLCGGHP